MTAIGGVIRFEAEGPAGTGLTAWEAMDPANLASGEPVQHGHLYDERPAAGYLAGVWLCTPFDDKPGPYPVDEFMLLLEGVVVMVMPDGQEITVRAGEAFVIPRGLACQWKMPETVRKVFMILGEPGTGGGANPSLSRIALPPLGGPAPDAPVETARTWFLNASGRMRVALRDCGAARGAALPAAANTLAHVASGGVTVSAEGGSVRFGPGETFYVRQGAVTSWQTEPGTRLLEATYAAP
jgi:uncharacterized cupin superfamily protein